MKKSDPSKRVLLKDIAKASGLSVSAVSMALRSHPRVSADTHKRIQALAQKMGYCPDPALSALARYRSAEKGTPRGETIAFLSDYPPHRKGRTLYFWHEYFLGCQTAANDLGYKLEYVHLKTPSMSHRRIESMLRARGIRGILVSGITGKDHRLNFDLNAFAAVSIGESFKHPQVFRISSDHYAGTRLVWKQLKARGYQRIGLVLGTPRDAEDEGKWKAAFLYEQNKIQAKHRVVPLTQETYTRRKIESWVRREKPDVVMTPEEKVIKILLRNGFVSNTLGLASLIPFQGVAGIANQREQVGYWGMEHLHAKLLTNRIGLTDTFLRVEQIHPTWIDGPTVRKQPRPGGDGDLKSKIKN